MRRYRQAEPPCMKSVTADCPRSVLPLQIISWTEPEPFGEREVMINTGDIRRDPDRAVKQIVDNVCRLAEDSGLRRSFSDKMRKLVDGNGALRIAEEIQAL